MVEPMYASTTFGTLLCRKCANAHLHRDERAFGIQSFVEDTWSLEQVLALLEGGNSRFREFCALTNAYPSLDGVDTHTEFIDGLYASHPVKAYRSLLRKSVGQVLQPRHRLSLPVPPIPPDPDQDCRAWDIRKGKDVSLLSVYDFYTTVLRKEWPTVPTEETKQEEEKTMGAVLDTDVEIDDDDDSSLGASVLDEILSLSDNQEGALSLSRSQDDIQHDKEHGNETQLQTDPSSQEDDGQEYVMALKSEDEVVKSPRRRDPKSDEYNDLGPMHTLQPTKTPDDEKSVISVGSSVGSLDLHSLPDNKSVASAELEPLPEVDEEDGLVKNLEPLPTEKSFHDLEENPPETMYGPENADARNIHELEAISAIHDNDDVSVGSGVQENQQPLKKTSALQRSIQMLDATIADSEQPEPVDESREKGKTIGFEGLPSNPPQRTESGPRKIPRMRHQQKSRVRPVDDNTELLEDFGPRRGSQSEEPSQEGGTDSETAKKGERLHFGFFDRRRSPVPVEGKMGPPVTKKSDYSPPMRQAYSFAHQQTSSVSASEESMSEEDKAPAAHRMYSAYKHQMRSLSRNLGRHSPPPPETKSQQPIPQMTGNLAPKGQEEWDANITATEEEKGETENGSRSGFGSLIRNTFHQHK